MGAPNDDLLVTVRVAADGSVRIGKDPVAPRRLTRRLWDLAERSRHLDDVFQRSNVPVLVRAEGHAPWSAVETVLLAIGDPDVRMFDVYWAVGESGAPERIVDGEPRTLIEDGPPRFTRVHVRIGSRREVSLLGETVGGTADLEPALRELATAHPGLPCHLHPDRDVAFREVVRVREIIRAAGYAVGGWSLIPPLWSVEIETGEPPDRIAEAEADLTAKDYVSARRRYEALAVPKVGDRPWVRASLTEAYDRPLIAHGMTIFGHRRLHPDVVEGLAWAVEGIGGLPELLSSAKLYSVLLEQEAAPAYGAVWWRWIDAWFRVGGAYAVGARDVRSLEELRVAVSTLRELGLLDRAPDRDRIEATESRVLRALASE